MNIHQFRMLPNIYPAEKNIETIPGPLVTQKMMVKKQGGNLPAKCLEKFRCRNYRNLRLIGAMVQWHWMDICLKVGKLSHCGTTRVILFFRCLGISKESKPTLWQKAQGQSCQSLTYYFKRRCVVSYRNPTWKVFFVCPQCQVEHGKRWRILNWKKTHIF